MNKLQKTYDEWIGNTETIDDYISLSQARRLQSTLDDTTSILVEGDALPPIWHWCYFLESAPQASLGPDGHAPRGTFLPPISLPRRMFAGGRAQFHAPLRIGQHARQVAKVNKIVEKQGRTGRLCFVTVSYAIEQDGKTCIEEERDFVYREAGARVLAPKKKQLAPVPKNSWSREIKPSPVMLFRYSALTFNGHRIHYDQPYATEVENYPGLIVHGPLLATFLLDLVRLNQDRPIEKFQFKANAPIFNLSPFRIIATSKEHEEVELSVEGPDGAPCMQAVATLGK